LVRIYRLEGTGANPIEIEIEDYDFESFVREAEDIRQQISNADASLRLPKAPWFARSQTPLKRPPPG
jgi:hypothetical protein